MKASAFLRLPQLLLRDGVNMALTSADRPLLQRFSQDALAQDCFSLHGQCPWDVRSAAGQLVYVPATRVLLIYLDDYLKYRADHYLNIK
jgi:hypothetical protein